MVQPSGAGATTADGGVDAGDAGSSTGGRLAYTLADLGPGFVHAIDPRGRVAGTTCTAGAGAPCRGAIHVPSSGWNPIPMPDGAQYVEAIGIDASGGIALNAWFPFHRSSYRRAYVASPERPLPTRSEAPQTTLFNVIHPATGHMVGYDESLGGAILYDGRTVTGIALQPGKTSDNGGPSQALALNAKDQVVGWMRPSPRADTYNSTPAHAFLWERGTAKDLGSQPPCESLAVAINEAGVVAGVIDTGQRCGEPRVFRWDGEMHVLGCPQGAAVCWAYGIDARGDIVGNALSGVLGPERGFISRDGAFHWLDELTDATGWTLEYPVAINEAGSIAGWGTLNGATHAFVLTPR